MAFFHTLLKLLKTCWKSVEKLKVFHIFFNNLSTFIQHFNIRKSFQLFNKFSTLPMWKTLTFKTHIYEFQQVFHSFNTPYYYYYIYLYHVYLPLYIMVCRIYGILFHQRYFYFMKKKKIYGFNSHQWLKENKKIKLRSKKYHAL